MTREEAHTLLEIMAINLTGAIASSDEPVTEQTKLMAKQIEAIDMAIEALSAEEAVWNEYEAEFTDLPDIPRYYYEKVVGKMAHEINMLKEQLESADAVSREEYEEVKEEYINTVGAILAVISAPSCLKEVNDLIEPLKVVRCKDCRHRCKEPIYSNADVHWVIYQIGDCPIICKTVSDDDYCSYGERREE